MNVDRQGNIRLVDLKYVDASNNLRITKGEVLFNNTNSPELVGKTAVLRADGAFAFSNHMTRLRPRAGLVPTFLAYQLHFLWMVGYFRRICRNHVNQASVSSKTLSQTVPLAVAPTAEQERIVAEIEKQFSRLDAAVDALHQVRANLKRYRAAVLKAACEGRLVPTEAELARAEDRDYESADKLLERILAERRAKWESDEGAKMRAAGKEPKDDGWKGKCPAPDRSDTRCLPRLPRGWRWATTAELADRIVDCPHSTPKFVPRGEACVDTTCMAPGRLLVERLRYVDAPTFEERNRRLSPQPGDVVFAREGTVGTAVALPITPSVCLGQRVMLVRPSKATDGRFLEKALMSSVVRDQYRTKLLGSTVAHLNVADVVKLSVPLPPRAEQLRIIDELARRDSITNKLEALVDANLRRAERLRQSILKRAFEGKLVPQDPNDEPASALLERIRQARPYIESRRVSKRRNAAQPPLPLFHEDGVPETAGAF